MKPLAILISAAALGAGAGALTHVALQPGPAAAAPTTVGGGELDALRGELRESARLTDELRAQLDALSRRVAEAPAAVARQPEQDVEAIVRRLLDERSSERAAARVAEGPASAEPAKLAGFRAEIAAADGDWEATEAIWKRAREAGLVDELVAEFERLAEERPGDPEAQLAAGAAYLQKIYDVPEGPERGLWATRADQAFDRALELDPRHWGARFTKAVSLSFWPPLFGKQAEAIRNFEVLVEQQQGQPLEPHFAQTYELLGNLYQQTGNQEKALEAWRAGAALFPDVESLQAKLAN